MNTTVETARVITLALAVFAVVFINFCHDCIYSLAYQDFVLRGPENRGAVGAEFETPKASSGEGKSGEGNGEGVFPSSAD